MKTLKFKPELVPLILSGEKITTWRLFDDKDLQIGDELIFINKFTGEEFAKAKIISLDIIKLKDIDEGYFSGHEKYQSPDELCQSFKSYYGDAVNLDTETKIVKFELI